MALGSTQPPKEMLLGGKSS